MFSNTLSFSANVVDVLDASIVSFVASQPVELLLSSHARTAIPFALPTYASTGLKVNVVSYRPLPIETFLPLLAGFTLYVPTSLPAVSYSVYVSSKYSVLLLSGLVIFRALPRTLLFLSLTVTYSPVNTVAPLRSTKILPLSPLR